MMYPGPVRHLLASVPQRPRAAGGHDPVGRARLLRGWQLRHPHRESGARGAGPDQALQLSTNLREVFTVPGEGPY